MINYNGKGSLPFRWLYTSLTGTSFHEILPLIELSQQLGLNIQTIDIGGGPIQYVPTEHYQAWVVINPLKLIKITVFQQIFILMVVNSQQANGLARLTSKMYR